MKAMGRVPAQEGEQSLLGGGHRLIPVDANGEEVPLEHAVEENREKDDNAGNKEEVGEGDQERVPRVVVHPNERLEPLNVALGVWLDPPVYPHCVPGA